jgi:hypothetical protein
VEKEVRRRNKMVITVTIKQTTKHTLIDIPVTFLTNFAPIAKFNITTLTSTSNFTTVPREI